MQRFVWLSVGAAVLVAAWFFVARGETFAAGDVESQAPEAEAPATVEVDEKMAKARI